MSNYLHDTEDADAEAKDDTKTTVIPQVFSKNSRANNDNQLKSDLT